MRAALSAHRLLLAAKTTLAVGAAWAIAPHMPGVTDQYPYYAPLGALISMYPTLMSSARSALQTLLAVAAGIALATLVVVTVGPSWWTIPTIVGVGVILSGTGWFGVGREYVPIAALFVLIIGGQNADAYSVGFVTQLGVGIAVGLLIHLLIPPATFHRYAAAQVDAFQQQLAAHLRDIGQAVTDSSQSSHDTGEYDARSLADTARAVRQALNEAEESGRGNPRSWLTRRSTEHTYERLDELDVITHHIRDISECLADTISARPGSLALDPALIEPLASACRAVANVIEHAGAPANGHRAREQAARAVRLLLYTMDERAVEDRRTMGPGVLTAMHLRRILISTRNQPTTSTPVESA